MVQHVALLLVSSQGPEFIIPFCVLAIWVIGVIVLPDDL